MGNSCNKVAPLGCCATPVICTAHISCSVPIWCGSPSCCSDPKVQPVVEPQPRQSQGPASPDGNGQNLDSSVRASNAAARAAGAPDGDNASGVGATNGEGTSTANGTGAAASPRPDVAGSAVDWREAGAIDGLEAGEPVAAEVESPGARLRQSQPGPVEEEEESYDEEEEALPAYNFNPEGLTALETYGLAESCVNLVTHASGRPVVQSIQAMCLYASNAGAAAWNCKRLLTQVKRVAEFLERALLRGGLRRLVRNALAQLQPVLARGEGLFASWEHKGTVEKFFSGRAADDEFVALHQELRDCCQSAPFLKLLSLVPAGSQHQQPPHPGDADAAGSSSSYNSSSAPSSSSSSSSLPAGDSSTPAGPAGLVEEAGGYGSVEASRVAFERLLLLFILRYKPSKNRSQKQRLMDVLYEYNSSWTSVDDKMEHLAKARLDRTATGALPLLKTIMTNMWGAGPELPRVRIEKWRLAVRLALEPLMLVTGSWQLPQTPEEGVEEFRE